MASPQSRDDGIVEVFATARSGQIQHYGDAGVGPVAAIRRGGTGHIMLFERNVWGGISATRQGQPNDIFILQ